MAADTELELEGPLLFREDGWSWAWIFAAPIFCGVAGLLSVLMGSPVHWVMLIVCAVATMLCHAVMIAATRVHGRVRLSETAYMQGTERLELDDVAGVFPPPQQASAESGRFGGGQRQTMAWEEARTLGELRQLPRRRDAIGLELVGGGLVRIWARDTDRLREQLTPLVGVATPRPPAPPDDGLDGLEDGMDGLEGLDGTEPPDDPGGRDESR